MIKLKLFIFIILFIFFIYYIVDIIIINKLEYFNNNFKCDTYGELCNKIDFNKDTCCIGYKCMRQPGNFNYKICVNDKDYVPTNVFVLKKTESSASPELPGSPKLPELPGSPKLPELPGSPKLPELPGSPELPGLPKLPELPGLPKLPELPGSPKLPELPGSPKLPELPGSPELPGLPELPRPGSLNLQNNIIPDVSYFGKNIFYDLEYNLKKSICKKSE